MSDEMIEEIAEVVASWRRRYGNLDFGPDVSNTDRALAGIVLDKVRATRAAIEATTVKGDGLVEDALLAARQRAVVLFQAYARGVAQRHGRTEEQFIHDVNTFSNELRDALATPEAADTITTLKGEIERLQRFVPRWLPPSHTPPVPEGSERYVIVAVRRAYNGQEYSFPACYLNGLTLNYEDEPYERQETGWFSAESDGDDGRNYSPLLRQGDELIAWCEVPNRQALGSTDNVG